jgi:hypothetical protein
MADCSACWREEAQALPHPFTPVATEPHAFLNQMPTLQPRLRAVHSAMARVSALAREGWSKE